jgi:hypothetical protein
MPGEGANLRLNGLSASGTLAPLPLLPARIAGAANNADPVTAAVARKLLRELFLCITRFF